VKQFLYAWCGKQKTSPSYEQRAVGSKIRQRFMCEVGVLFVGRQFPFSELFFMGVKVAVFYVEACVSDLVVIVFLERDTWMLEVDFCLTLFLKINCFITSHLCLCNADTCWGKCML